MPETAHIPASLGGGWRCGNDLGHLRGELAGRRALVVHGAHARGVRAQRGPVAATPTDAAASAHVLACPMVGQSQRNERGFMMNQTGGWNGWMGRRRDVDLDGDRRTGGGLTGRRDTQLPKK